MSLSQKPKAEVLPPRNAMALDILVLVDTGMIDSTSELDAEWGVRFDALKIPHDVVCVINTHMHFDHCGGNRLFPGIPIHVQRAELEAARAPGHTIEEWVDFDGANYVEHEGEAVVLPGVRLLPTPGHAPGHQWVLVDTDDGLVVIGGDVGYTWKQFDERVRPDAALAGAAEDLARAQGGARDFLD